LKQHLPPDAELQALGAAINARLKEYPATVNFYRELDTETKQERVGIVFCYAGKRSPTPPTSRMLSVADIDELVASVRSWITGLGAGERWTMDPSETAWRS
jgi:hypothetical protein